MKPKITVSDGYYYARYRCKGCGRMYQMRIDIPLSSLYYLVCGTFNCVQQTPRAVLKTRFRKVANEAKISFL